MMGTLVRFELKKILGNKAGMAACALVLVMLAAVATLNLLTMDAVDVTTGELVHGIAAQRAYAHMQASHAGALDDARIMRDVATLDQANQLMQKTQGISELSDREIVDKYGLEFWRTTRGVIEQGYYLEIVGTLESASPRASSLEDGARARIDGLLESGFWGYHPYTDAEKAYWRQLVDKISWPLEWGYDGGWHYAITWKGFVGLAIVALCIALSGVFAGEYRDRTVAVVLPTSHGKKALPIAKAIAALLFATGYWCVLALGVVAIHVGIYGTEGWGLPLQVTLGLDNPYPLTVGQAVIASYALGYLVALGMASLTLLLSARLRSTMPVAVVPMAIVFLGVIGLFSTPLAKVALLTPFSGMSYALDAMVSYAVGPIVVDLATVLAALYGTMAIALTPLAIRAFGRHQVV
jgi:ABC-type transport system involved in multi-copper enzyme maturation permease subunit